MGLKGSDMHSHEIDDERRRQYARGYALGIAVRMAGRYLEYEEDLAIRNKWFGYCGWSDGVLGKPHNVASARQRVRHGR
jgi:hypothetical protein